MKRIIISDFCTIRIDRIQCCHRQLAVIGTRKLTVKRLSRARQVVRELVESDYTMVSDLAAGIVSIAHKTAIEENGRTIEIHRFVD